MIATALDLVNKIAVTKHGCNVARRLREYWSDDRVCYAKAARIVGWRGACLKRESQTIKMPPQADAKI
jgi:hypothetical protein